MTRVRLSGMLVALAMLLALIQVSAAELLAPEHGDFILSDFAFVSGEKLPELRMHYRTLGKLERDSQGRARNAVLILHGTGGSGAQFMRPEFAGELFGSGGMLDASRYFIILPDNIGHGQSSKPSDGLRARFPRYGYIDMIEAQLRLLREGLGVDHLRLVMGASMGGMHTWLWGERHPDFMDALMPLASLPAQISGRNRVWRRILIDAIRNDPEWRNGNYSDQPQSLRTAQQMLFLVGSNPVLRQNEMPTLVQSDAVLDATVENSLKTADANDLLYQVEASRDYDPAPDLEKIRAPLVAINFADDLINPPELRILEREITRVPHGRALVLPLSPETRGHGTHTVAKVWKQHLQELLERTAPDGGKRGGESAAMSQMLAESASRQTTGDREMYGLIGKMTAAPGQRDQLISILLEGTAAMPGCLSYIVAKDSKDENGVWISEVWDSKESHAGSLALPEVRQAIARGRPLIKGMEQGAETVPVGGVGLR